MEEMDDFDILVGCVGGGGLMSGIGGFLSEKGKRIYGVEPKEPIQ